MSGKFFWEDLPPPGANISGKKFLGALFFSKSAPQTLPPPTFWSFLRPWLTILEMSTNRYCLPISILSRTKNHGVTWAIFGP
jgi:hypothetical protein